MLTPQGLAGEQEARATALERARLQGRTAPEKAAPAGEQRKRRAAHEGRVQEPRLELLYSTRFPWTPLWGRRGGPEEIGGMLTERQLNGSGELPERWSAKRKTEIVLRLLRGEDLG